MPIEHEAVYFLRAAQELNLPSVIGLVAPRPGDGIEARRTETRIRHWAADVALIVPADDLAASLERTISLAPSL